MIVFEIAIRLFWTLGLAHSLQRSLLTPEDLDSNPAISIFYKENVFIVNCRQKTKIKEKEAKNGPLRKTFWLFGNLTSRVEHH